MSDMTRRSFLTRTSAGIALAGIGATILQTSARAEETSDKKLGFAFVGLGSFAMNQLIPNIDKSKHCKLAALVSGHPDKAKQVAEKYGLDQRNIYNYDNYDTIKDNPNVDVIYIVLPNSMHKDFTIRGFKAGKHIMCEKPMAVSSAECQEMIDAGKAAGKKLQIGYRMHYEVHQVEAIRMLRAKELGELKQITTDMGFRLRNTEAWRLHKDLSGGGALMDIGIYGLNASRYLTGEEPIEVSAMTYTPKDDPVFATVEEGCNWLLKFPSGVLCSNTSSYSYAGQTHWRAICTEGYIDCDPAISYSGVKMRVSHKGKSADMNPPELNQFATEMDVFADCIMNNKEPRSSGEEGLRDVKIMEAIYEAARTGKTIKLA
ncbi:MAG TPA: Gfo/Idh/MocA family oxidoreductase [Tepidisphaeraceae bacterium]|jgi:predicted dehydrogenase|nr:Gfo/Idh/MocA family oxidoreductase [Tepidisphaeraceae bacterium]